MWKCMFLCTKCKFTDILVHLCIYSIEFNHASKRMLSAFLQLHLNRSTAFLSHDTSHDVMGDISIDRLIYHILSLLFMPFVISVSIYERKHIIKFKFHERDNTFTFTYHLTIHWNYRKQPSCVHAICVLLPFSPYSFRFDLKMCGFFPVDDFVVVCILYKYMSLWFSVQPFWMRNQQSNSIWKNIREMKENWIKRQWRAFFSHCPAI